MQNSKITLGVDTSGVPLVLAVEKEGKKYTQRKSGIKQERLLFPAINNLLSKANATLKDIENIFIVRGPGRFTGIRIGITFASMLQMLNKAKVAGATVFEIIRYQVENSKKFISWKKKNPTGKLAIILHAFREEYFLQFFTQEPGDPKWLSKEELLQILSEQKEPLFVAGHDKEKASLGELLQNKYILAEQKNCVIQAATLLEMAKEEKWQTNTLEPLYLKPARFELITPK